MKVVDNTAVGICKKRRPTSNMRGVQKKRFGYHRRPESWKKEPTSVIREVQKKKRGRYHRH